MASLRSRSPRKLACKLRLFKYVEFFWFVFTFASKVFKILPNLEKSANSSLSSHFGFKLDFFNSDSASSAEDALENINQLSEGIVHELLKNFLETNLPKVNAHTHSFRFNKLDQRWKVFQISTGRGRCKVCALFALISHCRKNWASVERDPLHRMRRCWRCPGTCTRPALVREVIFRSVESGCISPRC